jgi:excisionase family DNA binding protein
MRGFYTTHEAARLLSVSLPTVVNWIKARRLKAHRTPGGHRRIAREELAAFMLRHGMPLPPELSGAAPARPKALIISAGGPAREGMARQLAEAGYAVEQASPGFAAGVAAVRFEPDVVVMAAPAPDGGETLRDLMVDRENGFAPVVGVGPAGWGEELLRCGCASAAAQPLGPGALEDAVARALAAERAARREGAAPRRGRARN